MQPTIEPTRLLPESPKVKLESTSLKAPEQLSSERPMNSAPPIKSHTKSASFSSEAKAIAFSIAFCVMLVVLTVSTVPTMLYTQQKRAIRVPLDLMIAPIQAHTAMLEHGILTAEYSEFARTQHNTDVITLVEKFLDRIGGGLLFNLHWISRQRNVKFTRILDEANYELTGAKNETLLIEAERSTGKYSYLLRGLVQEDQYDELLVVHIDARVAQAGRAASRYARLFVSKETGRPISGCKSGTSETYYCAFITQTWAPSYTLFCHN